MRVLRMGMYVAKRLYSCSILGIDYSTGSNLGEPFLAGNYKKACKTAKRLYHNIPMRVDKVKGLENSVKKDK